MDEEVDGDVFVEHGKLVMIPVGAEYKIPEFAKDRACLFQAQADGILQVAVNQDHVDGTILDITLFKQVSNMWLTPNDEKYAGNVATGPAGRVLMCDPVLLLSHMQLAYDQPTWFCQFDCEEGTGLMIDLEILGWVDIIEDADKIEVFTREGTIYYSDDDEGEDEYVKSADEVLRELEDERHRDETHPACSYTASVSSAL